MNHYFLVIALIFTFIPTNVYAKESFDHWLSNFKVEAQKKGNSKKSLETIFKDVKPLKKVIQLDRKQPEGSISFSKYLSNVVTKARISQGKKLYKQHKILLEKISKKYEVPAPYIVALWGMETSYGHSTGGFDVIAALATLAYDGRRSEFFRSELLDALKILREGHITHEKMRGSWAGAMGQNQFMPSSFHRFAIDENGDGKRDIWTTDQDVFASTANYLHNSGWNEDERWGREVKLPKPFSKKYIGFDKARSLKEWQKLGVRLPDGSDLPKQSRIQAWLIAPDGINGPAYLAYPNYRVIMKWNKSTYFATSVGILADLIAQP